MSTPHFYPVIPAGGSGTRLWPLSRAAHPKFLHALTGTDRTLLQATVDRTAVLAPPSRTYVVTGTRHAAAVARQLPDVPAANVLVEPAPKDSGPAIGLAAALLVRRDPEAVMGSFAADHLVRNPAAFTDAVRTAIATAADGHLVAIGLTPTAPEPGYGYIHCGDPMAGGARAVRAFTEKPSVEAARAYLASGEYLWNASMFLWRAEAVLDEIDRQLPVLGAGLARIADAWDTAARDEVLAATWPTLPRISIDHGVMEGAAARGRVAVVPASLGWNDVGDWHTLGAVLPADGDGNVVVGDPARVLARDTAGSVAVPAADRLVALLGVRDVVVVDTPDAVLVCARDHAQQVKGLVDALASHGAADLR